MPTINGKACVINSTPVDKVFSNGSQVYGRNMLTGTSGDLQTKQIAYDYNVGAQATNGSYKIKIFKGQTYTYRAWLDNTNGQDGAYVNARCTPIGGSNYNLGNGTHINPGKTGYSTLQITPTEDGYLLLIPFAYGTPHAFLAMWKEEKLETGKIATPWTPAPEDVM